MAKVDLLIKRGGYKLGNKAAKLVTEKELQDKHYRLPKIRKEIRSIVVSLKSSLALILCRWININKENVRKKTHKTLKAKRQC